MHSIPFTYPSTPTKPIYCFLFLLSFPSSLAALIQLYFLPVFFLVVDTLNDLFLLNLLSFLRFSFNDCLHEFSFNRLSSANLHHKAFTDRTSSYKSTPTMKLFTTPGGALLLAGSVSAFLGVTAGFPQNRRDVKTINNHISSNVGGDKKREDILERIPKNDFRKRENVTTVVVEGGDGEVTEASAGSDTHALALPNVDDPLIHTAQGVKALCTFNLCFSNYSKANRYQQPPRLHPVLQPSLPPLSLPRMFSQTPPFPPHRQVSPLLHHLPLVNPASIVPTRAWKTEMGFAPVTSEPTPQLSLLSAEQVTLVQDLLKYLPPRRV